MNNVIIKADNRGEYNKILDILGGLGITWNSGETLSSKDDKVNPYDSISTMIELFGIFEEKGNEPVLCLIVKHNKLFWEFIDSIIKDGFDVGNYEVYSFKEFEKAYSL